MELNIRIMELYNGIIDSLNFIKELLTHFVHSYILFLNIFKIILIQIIAHNISLMLLTKKNSIL